MAFFIIIGATLLNKLFYFFLVTKSISLEAFFIRPNAILLKTFTPVLAASLPA